MYKKQDPIKFYIQKKLIEVSKLYCKDPYNKDFRHPYGL